MNIKLIVSSAICGVLMACSGQSEKQKVVVDFWHGMSTNDQQLLESVLLDKSAAGIFG